MDLREPVSCAVSLAYGTMAGGAGRYEKRMRDLTDLYADEAALPH